jgi:solute carrier family 25 (adenine nucleotide translocator) protein 4/5/6/31
MRRRKSLLVSFLSGGAAGATATTIFYPLEYTRTRLALDSGSGATRLYPGGLRDVIRRTVRVDGAGGLYKGYPVALFGIVLFRALSMGGYDFVKGEMEISNSAPLYRRFLAAQLVSVAAGTICYPIDTVRRKLMMQAGSKKKLYDSTYDCVKCIIETHGYR